MSAPRTAVPPDRAVTGFARRPALPAALDEMTTNRATGALHVDGAVAGSIYLVDGEVYYVQTPAATGVDCLLQASGTVPPPVFRTAWAAGAANGRVGEVLIESGALSRGEAELCTDAAITDGAYALLTAEPDEVGSVRFAAGEGHWWGVLRRVGVAALDATVHRRRRLLDRTPPTDLDDQPIAAAGRLGRHHIVLTDLQWELVVHADGRRTPRELARLLGRSAYSAILETRRLAAAGLVQIARTGPSAELRASPEDIGSIVEPQPEETVLRTATGRSTPVTRSRRKPELPVRPPEAGQAGQAGRPEAGQAAPLPRRQPGAALRGVVPVSPRGEPAQPGARGETSILDVPEPDNRLLSRVRNALEGLR